MSNVDPNEPGWRQQQPQRQPGQQPPQQFGQPFGQQPNNLDQPGWQQYGVQGHQNTVKKSPIGRIAIIMSLVLVATAGGFLAFRALNGGTGAASPQEATDRVIEAMDNEDFLTLGESLVPNEREATFEPTINLIKVVPIPKNRLPSDAIYAKSSATSYGDGKILLGQMSDMETACQIITSIM